MKEGRTVMTQTAMGGIGELRALMDGPVITPADAGFEDARRVWNAQINRRPSVIARCTSAADVAAAIGYARERQLEISVRGGAHGTAAPPCATAA
jgi:FAD/FMN-containing dehydrogenase